MLNIPENVKNTFLEESSHKILKFTTNPNWLYPEDAELQKDMDELNLFNGNAYLGGTSWGISFDNSNPFTDSYTMQFKINRYSSEDSHDATNAVETFALKYRNYVDISMALNMYPSNSTYPQQMRFGIVYEDSAGVEREALSVFNVEDYINPLFSSTVRVSVTVPTYKLSTTGVHTIKSIVLKSIQGNVSYYGNISYGYPIISVSDNPDSFPIQYSEVDYTTLDKTEYIPFVLFDNENIVFDKFSMTESLCSKDNIEFGLCEAGHIEVDTVNIGDVKDETFYPVIGVPDPNAEVPYTELKRINWYKGSRYNYSPQSGFWVSWNLSSSSNNIYTNRIGDVDIASYSNYFTEASNVYLKCDIDVEYFTAATMPVYVRPALDFTRSNSTIYIFYDEYIELSELLDGTHSIFFNPVYDNANGTIESINNIRFYFYDANKDPISVQCSTKISFTDIQVGMLKNSSESIPEFDLNTCCIYNNNLDEYLAQYQYSYVPLGKYTVKDITKKISHNLTIKTLSMYDDMVILEQNAANWYTQYMYGISTNEASPYGYEFARQIYSSYYNYMRTTGIVSEPADMTQILTKTYNELESTMSTKNVPFLKLYYESTKELHNTGILYYAYVDIANPNPQKLYSVKWFNYQYQSEVYVPWYYMHDKYNRGLETANILVEERLSDGSYNKFLVDPDDLFALSPSCTQLKLYVPMYGKYTSFADKYYLLDHIEVYTTDKTFDLANASTRLLYYDTNLNEVKLEEPDEELVNTLIDRCIPHTIFDCDSNITGRDVVHSLLELTGCFFRMSRETGAPEFIYCTKSGLYPSNTLYPADDLYPRAGTNQVEGMGKYMSTECADYAVTKFGKIQILKNQSSNKAESNVQWQYVGDEDVGLNTYIIADNIFYSNKDLTYIEGQMPEMDRALSEMFYRISNMDYTPNVTKALGLPWLECGDRLGLLTYDGGFETFVYRRKLDGIQLLKDTYESHGDEYNNAIKSYGY